MPRQRGSDWGDGKGGQSVHGVQLHRPSERLEAFCHNRMAVNRSVGARIPSSPNPVVAVA